MFLCFQDTFICGHWCHWSYHQMPNCIYTMHNYQKAFNVDYWTLYLYLYLNNRSRYSNAVKHYYQNEMAFSYTINVCIVMYCKFGSPVSLRVQPHVFWNITRCHGIFMVCWFKKMLAWNQITLAIFMIWPWKTPHKNAWPWTDIFIVFFWFAVVINGWYLHGAVGAV